MAFLTGFGRPGDRDTLRRKMQGSEIEVKENGRDGGSSSAHRRGSSSHGRHKSRRKGSGEKGVEIVYVRTKSKDTRENGKRRTSAAGSKKVGKGDESEAIAGSGRITREKSSRRTSMNVTELDGLDRRKGGDDGRVPMKRSTSRKHSFDPTTILSPVSSHRPPLSRSKTTSTATRRMPRLSEHPPVSYNQARVDRAASASVSASAPSRPKLDRSRSTRTSSGRSNQPSSRTSAHRTPTTSHQTSRPPSRPHTTRTSNSNSKSQSRPKIVSSFFGGPPPAPEKELECVSCLVEYPASKVLTLHCKHHMCHECLKRVFTISLTDPQTMPPKCCDATHPIDPSKISKIFDTAFKKEWNRKYVEFTTKNRIYCPRKGCGEWIKPSHIHTLPASPSDRPGPRRKYGQCSKCKTRVCTTCNAKFHSSRDCPKDPATLAFQKIVKEKGWQRCHNCKATVEQNQGCNHMTCRCGAEFCMVCGVKWKGCDCPMFGDEAVQEEHDRAMREMPGMPPAGGWFWWDDVDEGPEWGGVQTREPERRVYLNGHRVADHGGIDYGTIEADDEALARRVEREMHINDYHYNPDSSPDPDSDALSDSDLIFVGGGPQRRDLAARHTTTRELPRRRGHDGAGVGGMGLGVGGGGFGEWDEGRILGEGGRGGGGEGGRRQGGGGMRMRPTTPPPPLNPYLSDDFFRRGHDILVRPYNDENDRDAEVLVEEIRNGRRTEGRRTGGANAPPMRRASTLAGVGTGVASRARRAGNGGGLNGRVNEWRRYVD